MIKLSILILSLPERINLLNKLLNILSPQISSKNNVELLILCDNKKRTIGEKRNELLNLSKGEYITFIDDDDLISKNYIRELLIAIKNNKADCINFIEKKLLDDKREFLTIRSIKYNYTRNKNTYYKKPNHLMCIKSDIAKSIKFKNINKGEDDIWGEEISKLIKTEYNINKILYYYHYSSNTSSIPF